MHKRLVELKQSITYPDLFVDEDGNVFTFDKNKGDFKQKTIIQYHAVSCQHQTPHVFRGSKYLPAARIALEAKLGRKLMRQERVSHLDGDLNNIAMSNLALTTQKGKKKRSIKTGTFGHAEEREDDETSWLGPDALYL